MSEQKPSSRRIVDLLTIVILLCCIEMVWGWFRGHGGERPADLLKSGKLGGLPVIGSFEDQIRAIESGTSHSLDLTFVSDPDAKLESIKGLKGLASISCGRANGLSDAGIATFASFADLKSVTLQNMRIPASWPPLLNGCPSLEEVALGPTVLLEFEMADLVELPRLRVLRLMVPDHIGKDERVSAWLDRALVGLCKAKQLETLVVVGGGFAQRKPALIELQEKLPGCQIVLFKGAFEQMTNRPTPLEGDERSPSP